ncbi:MAG TPA: SMC-Scp complex subunit ScpB [Nitrospiria bacterium]|nr:SMC-Scp complex subunit ScpB [Nitrospiria bacterium]
MEEIELRAALEGLLFVSGEPMSIDKLSEVLEGVDKERVTAVLADLEVAYRQADRGLQIVQVAGGYQMVTRPEISPWIKRLERIKNATRLSKPSLETLAIVAYRQPVTRPEIEEIRGVDSSGVLKTLMDRRLVKIVGRKEIAGRPMIYGTTREFLQYFGLSHLSALPTLKEFSEIVPETDDQEDALGGYEVSDEVPAESHPVEKESVDPAGSRDPA